jgi:hypothetical protein
MQLFGPFTDLRRWFRGRPIWLVVLAAPLYLLVFIAWLISLPLALYLLLLHWLLGPLLGPLIAPISRSRAVRWLSTKRVEDLLMDIVERISPLDWDVTQASDLLERIRTFRRILLAFIVGQWAILVVLGLLMGASLLCSLPDLIYFGVIPGVGALVIAAVLSAVGLSYYRRLCQCWRKFDMPTCGRCGYIRKDRRTVCCPECGSAELTVRPGCMPAFYMLWEPLLNKGTAGTPFLLLCAAFYVDRMVLNVHLAAGPHGWVVLVITASVAGLILWVLWFFTFRWKKVYLRGRDDDRTWCAERGNTRR